MMRSSHDGDRGTERGYASTVPDHRTYLIDMDGVLVRGFTPVPGAAEFLERLKAREIRHLVLTNNPLYTPRDLAHRLNGIGLPIAAERPHGSLRARPPTARPPSPPARAGSPVRCTMPGWSSPTASRSTSCSERPMTTASTGSRAPSAFSSAGRVSSPPTPTPPDPARAASRPPAARSPR